MYCALNYMIMKKYILAFIVGTIGLSACSDSIVDFGEQYKKTVYLVNSRDLLYTGEHAYDVETNEIMVSVYCASSEPIKKDLDVKLFVDEEALKAFNTQSALSNPLYVDKILLPESYYDLNNTIVTIEAGHQYGVLRIPLRTEGLNPDISYVLPLSIESNSAGYDINPDLRSLIYEIKMTNEYSGDYSGSSIESAQTIRSVQPTLQAISANQVRMPIHNLSSSVENLDTNFMVLTIAQDGTVSITPWGNAKVIDLNKSFYDRKQKRYELYYEFTTEDGNVLEIEEKITNIDAPKEDEEDEE